MNNSVWRSFCRFVGEDEAATAVEYSVMLGLILVACLVVVQAVGDNASGVWNDIAQDLDNVRAN
jgi:Flp pilus assembly pilin Flp